MKTARAMPTLAVVAGVCFGLLLVVGAVPPIEARGASIGAALGAWGLLFAAAVLGALVSRSPIVTGSVAAVAVTGLAYLGSTMH